MWSDANTNLTIHNVTDFDPTGNETEMEYHVIHNVDPNRDMYLGVYGGLGFGQVEDGDGCHPFMPILWN